MKLHLSVSKDNLRPALKHIQIKGGFIYATNCHILTRIPVNEVFTDLFNNEDELKQFISNNNLPLVYNHCPNCLP